MNLSTRMPAADPLVSLRLFIGAATPAECRVYAEVDARDVGGGECSGMTLSGRITGPYCPYAQTLSATQRFVDRGPGRTLLAEACVTEACFWTPEFPYLYEVEIKLCRESEEIASARRIFGMRWFAAEGRTLLCERQPWILAALRTKRPSVDDLDVMHESGIAAVLASPDDSTCVAASRIGVLMVADVAQRGEALVHELARLAQWPAVVFAILPGDVDVSSDARRAAGNVLLVQDAQLESFERGEVDVAPWAQVVAVAAQDSPLPGPKLSRTVPHFETYSRKLELQSMPGFRSGFDVWRNRRTTAAGDTPEVLPSGYILTQVMQ